jgi:hypothetical protein
VTRAAEIDESTTTEATMHKLNELELATVLTALRVWQKHLIADDFDPADVDESIGTLTAEEIDTLCEELNK